MASRLTAVALLVFALSSCRSSADKSVEPSPSTASPSASVTESASASLGPSPLPTLVGWQVISVPIGGTVYSVAEGPGGWVAVGRASESGGPVWFSRDGVSWVPATTVPPANYEPILYDVVAVGPGYVAAGSDFLVDGGPPIVWTSSNGLQWTAASIGDGVTLGNVNGLTELAGRYFAGGGLIGDGGFGTGPAVIWSSANATDWTQTILDSRSAIGTYASTPVSFAGELVSVGGAYRPYTGLGWTSGDGAQWSLVQSAAFEDALLEEAAVVGAELVAVGEIYEDRDDPHAVPGIWTSEDAHTWELAYTGACCRRIEHVAAFGDGALAIAGDVVYMSQDGVTWSLGGTIGGFSGQLVELVVTPSLGVVAIGNDGDNDYLLVPPAT